MPSSDETQSSWFQRKFEAVEDYFKALTLKKMYERFNALQKPKEITINAAFTTFFLTLLLTAVASFEVFILGVIILLEAYNVGLNLLQAATKNLPRPTRIALNTIAAVLSIAVVFVVVSGFIPLLAGVVAAATPFVFLTVMAYAIGLNIYLANDARKKKRRTNDLIDKLSITSDVADENTDLLEKDDTKKEVLINLVSNTTQLAFLGLKELLESNVDLKSKLFSDDLTEEETRAFGGIKKYEELKNNIIASLDLHMSDDDIQTLTLQDIQDKLINQVNKESKQFINSAAENSQPINLLNDNGSYNEAFFEKKGVIISALEKSAAEQNKKMLYHSAQAGVFGTVFAAIAAALGPAFVVGAAIGGAIGGGIVAGAALAKTGIVAAAVSFLGLNTLYSAVTAKSDNTEKTENNPSPSQAITQPTQAPVNDAQVGVTTNPLVSVGAVNNSQDSNNELFEKGVRSSSSSNDSLNGCSGALLAKYGLIDSSTPADLTGSDSDDHKIPIKLDNVYSPRKLF